MPDRLSFGPILLSSTGSAPSPAAPRPDSETPFRILILGDFGAHPDSASVTSLKPIRVDLDNQDAVMARLDVRITIPFDGAEAPPVDLRFSSLEDFHPDQLCEQLPWFKNVLGLRAQLEQAATFASAAAQLPNWIEVPTAGHPPEQGHDAKRIERTPDESTDGLLERLLGKPASEPAAPGPQPDINRLIRHAVGSSAVPAGDPRQAGLIAAVDIALTERLRNVLHHPRFQAVEAAWRGLDLLIKNIELNETIELFFLHLSKDTLRQDLASAEDLRTSRFYQAVVAPVAQGPGSIPWGVWGGDYVFTHEPEDAALLAALGKMAKAAGTPFIASMARAFMDLWDRPEPPSPEVLRDWNGLRRLPEASHLALALPRILLRLPYGKKSDPVDRMPFEEMPTPPRTARYLWGNPAFACVCLLGQSFNRHGWDLGENLLHELEGLPLHVYQEEGESKMTPCAEIWLNDNNSEDLLANGLLPIQSIQRRDAIRVPRFQSIRDPLAALAGRWS